MNYTNDDTCHNEGAGIKRLRHSLNFSKVMDENQSISSLTDYEKLVRQLSVKGANGDQQRFITIIKTLAVSRWMVTQATLTNHQLEKLVAELSSNDNMTEILADYLSYFNRLTAYEKHAKPVRTVGLLGALVAAPEPVSA